MRGKGRQKREETEKGRRATEKGRGKATKKGRGKTTEKNRRFKRTPIEADIGTADLGNLGI